MRSKYGKCRLLRSIDKNPYDVTDNRGESDVILCFYLSILEDDMFRTLECIESNQPYYTTLDKFVAESKKFRFKVSTFLNISIYKYYISINII